MAVPHLLFLVQTPFGARDERRFGLAPLQGAGARVSICDVGHIVLPGGNHDRSHYDRLRGVELAVLRHNRDLGTLKRMLAECDLAVCLVGSGFVDEHNLAVLRTVSASPKPTVAISTNAIPTWHRATATTNLWRRLRGMRLKRTLFNRLPLSLWGVRPLDNVLYSGWASQVRRRMVAESTRPVWAHSEDYENYLDAMAAPDEPRDIAVFIDQFFGYHPGANVAGFQQAVDPAVFYPKLRRYFDRLEAAHGLEVVIAGHPRSDYSKLPDLFGGRAIYTGSTSRLIGQGRMAITSFSTAAGLCALFRKPLTVYTSRSIRELAYVHDAPGALARWLKTVPVDMDEPDSIDLGNALCYDPAAYDAYVKAFIRSPKSSGKRMWQILLDLATEKA